MLVEDYPINRMAGPVKEAIYLEAERPEDNWAHRSGGMKCITCMWFVSKGTGRLGRCRRHAPTISGFVPVFEDDWCGDHRLDDTKI